MRKSTTHEVLTAPMPALCALLPPEDELSSRQLAEATGISASVIRSIRNGRTANTRVDVWARLMHWALVHHKVEELPVPTFRRRS